MTWEILVGLIGAVTALIGSIWAIVKHYDNKRENRRKEEIKNDRAYFDSKFDEVNETNRRQQEQLTVLSATVDSINTDLETIHVQLDDEQQQIFDNEMQRLRHEIIDFAGRLRAGEELTQNQFEYICEVYDRYHSRGGNHFATIEFEYILAKKRELDSLQ